VVKEKFLTAFEKPVAFATLLRNFDDARAPAILGRRKIGTPRHHERRAGIIARRSFFRSKSGSRRTVTTIHCEAIERDERKWPASAHQIDKDRSAFGVELYDFTVEYGVIGAQL
jgi:hypothetical protein